MNISAARQSRPSPADRTTGAPQRNVLTVIAAPHWGGPHVVVERTSGFYESAGYRRIVALPCTHEERQRLERAGCTVIPMRMGRVRKTLNPLVHARFLFNFFREVGEIRRVMRDNRIDVVEVAGLLVLQPVAAALISARPLVWQMHSMLAPAPIRRLIGSIATRTAAAVVTSGRGLIEQHGGLAGSSRPVLSFNAPVDVARFRPNNRLRAKVRKELGYREDEVVVGTLGNRGWPKRHELIVAMADRLRDSGMRFLIAGAALDSNDHYYRDKVLRPIAELGLEDVVQVVEQRHAPHELLNGFDIFVLPSISEAASLVTCEAMATGLPLVVSKAGSLGDNVIHGTNGFLCDVHSLNEYCEALTALRDPGMRAQMGAASRDKAERELGNQGCADTHFRSYEIALAS